MFQITTTLQKLLKLRKRIRAVSGGTSAAKTISILQILIDKAQSDKNPKITSVTSESMPHLKKGAMRDFLNIMQQHNYFDDKRWNRSDFVYTFETGSTIEFFSLDMPHKVRGPRRDRLFINEANNIPYETFDQLEVRTNEEIWIDWNPVSSFWFYEDEEGGPGVQARDDVDFLIVTYKDNEALPESIVKTIEARRHKQSWWKVYGEGQLGEAEGRVYTDWQIINEIPHEARLERYGLDFGYTNDPTAIVAVYYYNGGYILDEIVYRKGMSNKDIAEVFKELPYAKVIADSAEPKSIDEIRMYGIRITPVVKGKDSKKQGIQYVQDQRISVTKQSVFLIKEYRNYLWQTDKYTGRRLNDPEDGDDHALDAVKYAFDSYRPKKTEPTKPKAYHAPVNMLTGY